MLNVYAHNNKASKQMKQKLIEIQGNIHNFSHISVTPLYNWYNKRAENYKDIVDLNNMVNQLDLAAFTECSAQEDQTYLSWIPSMCTVLGI